MTTTRKAKQAAGGLAFPPGVADHLPLIRDAIRKANPGREHREFWGPAAEAVRRCLTQHDPRRGPWESFATKAVVNAVRDELRSRRRHARRFAQVDELHPGAAPGESPLEAAIRREEESLLAHAVRRVHDDRSRRHGEVAALMARGLTVRRIGAQLGIGSTSVVHKLAAECMGDLRDYVGADAAD